MTLEMLAARYALGKDIEPGTHEWLKTVVRRYAKHIGRSPTVDDLNDDAVNGWLTALIAEGLSRITVKGYRGGIVMLWRFAAELKLRPKPEMLRTIKAPKPIPCAWTTSQVNLLFAQAQAMQGYYRSGVHRGRYWSAFVLVLWESALRIGDLLQLQWEEIGESGMVVKQQRKTSWPTAFRLSAETLTALERIRQPERRLVFGGIVSRDWAFETFKKLATSAGLKGGTKKVRKSAATAVERIQPGAATALLGHKTPTMARDYYLDPRLLSLDHPTPPPLGSA